MRPKQVIIKGIIVTKWIHIDKLWSYYKMLHNTLNIHDIVSSNPNLSSTVVILSAVSCYKRYYYETTKLFLDTNM